MSSYSLIYGSYGLCFSLLHMVESILLMLSVFRSLSAIGKGCKKLRNLTLSDCYLLSDKGLEAIATGCSELTHLEINGCHNIGTTGLEFVGKTCQYVFHLCCKQDLL